MDYTHKTIELIDLVIEKVQSVVDLGAQNDYRHPTLPAPYVKDTYYANKKYVAFDISGENGSKPYDLSQLHDFDFKYDLLVDAGTSEHVGDNGKFGWKAIYNCWINKHNLVKVGGYIVSENPKTGNWPGHGFNYYTKAFYENLASVGGYNIIAIGEHPAMGNDKDGWNVYCVMEKINEDFPTFSKFKELGIERS